MKRKLLIPLLLTLAVALLPSASFAGDDVTINDSVSLSVNGAGLAITSGAKINKIVVSGTSFSTTMSGTSTIKVVSGARRTLTVTPSNMASSATCTASESTVSIGASSTGDPVVVTVDVSSNTCSGSGSSGNGGGSVVGVTTGGGSSSPAPAPAPLPTPVPPATPVTPAAVATIVAAATVALNSAPPPATGVSSGGSVGAVFTKNLTLGATHADVKRLQQLLNTDPDTKISDAGVGSPGNESNYYGALTVKAVQKFQAKHGLVHEGTPSTTGFGVLGPKTRAAVEMYLGNVTPTTSTEETATPVSSPVSMTTPPLVGAPIVYLTNALAKGKTHNDIRSLQLVLNSDSETKIATTGIGSPGNETDFFGALTEKAVQKFQVKHGIAALGDPGYGAVGPMTRAKINELFGQQQGTMEVEVSQTPTPTPEIGGSTSSIQEQINAALKKVADLQAQIGTQTLVTPPAPTPPPVVSSDAAAIQKQIDDAMKKIQEISDQIKNAS